MSFTSRIVDTVRQWWRPPSPGRLVVPDLTVDGLAEYLTRSLTVTKIRSTIEAADAGNLAMGLQLYADVEEDATLFSVSNTRRGALTGLEFEVISASEVEEGADQALADDAAEYVRGQLATIETFGPGLKHLARAIGDNLAVVELVWDGSRIVELNPVPVDRLRMDAREPGVIRVMTAEERLGIAAVGPKWVVHSPTKNLYQPLRPAIARAALLPYLVGHMGIMNWSQYVEIFGMPVRVARYQPTATTEEKRELALWMKHLGARAWGVFSQAVNVEMIESSQRSGTAPYEALMAACDRAKAKLWLGGNLVADTTGGTGTHAAASVQNEVREDLRDDDLAAEAATVRKQIFEPMCRARFYRDVPLPHFRRVKPEVIDRTAAADLFAKAQAAGVAIPKAYAYATLGIPEPQEGEEILEPAPDPFADTMEGDV